MQRWLNKTFGHVHGWVPVDEDGLTGSGTVLGIVQATQSLLGISPVVATFGPTTRQKLEQHGDVGAETGDDAETWRRLVQAGLICKGASTVSLTGAFDAATVAAAEALRSDLGAAPGGLPLSAHLFGALLTVDPVRLASGGSRSVRTVQQYLNRTYAEAVGGAHGSTSGVVDTSTYAAAIRAVQVAVGVTVDGAWGPGTAAALRAAGPSVVGVGATGAWVLLVKALLVLNGERVVFSSAYSAADAAVVRAFQQFQAFPPAEQTGTCDAGTWAALAASTGDPDRATTGADTAVRLDDDARCSRPRIRRHRRRPLPDEPPAVGGARQGPDARRAARDGERRARAVADLRGGRVRRLVVHRGAGCQGRPPRPRCRSGTRDPQADHHLLRRRLRRHRRAGRVARGAVLPRRRSRPAGPGEPVQAGRLRIPCHVHRGEQFRTRALLVRRRDVAGVGGQPARAPAGQLGAQPDPEPHGRVGERVH
ncbi:peptidoglycan-binding domain-containing protein [Curtobacterium flaccumfaciens]|nr:peptidoglycan-binding domain-containing protein [Curtobacterium flaccumfaciens]